MTLSDNIKTRREALQLTLEAVAKVVGVTRATIQKYENGLISNIPSDKIELLAEALKTTPSQLMGWQDIQDTPPTPEPMLPLDDFTYAMHSKSTKLSDKDKKILIGLANQFITDLDAEEDK